MYIARIFEEFTSDDIVSLLDEVLTNSNEYIETIPINSISIYIEIYGFFEQEYANQKSNQSFIMECNDDAHEDRC